METSTRIMCGNTALHQMHHRISWCKKVVTERRAQYTIGSHRSFSAHCFAMANTKNKQGQYSNVQTPAINNTLHTTKPTKESVLYDEARNIKQPTHA